MTVWAFGLLMDTTQRIGEVAHVLRMRKNDASADVSRRKEEGYQRGSVKSQPLGKGPLTKSNSEKRSGKKNKKKKDDTAGSSSYANGLDMGC